MFIEEMGVTLDVVLHVWIPALRRLSQEDCYEFKNQTGLQSKYQAKQGCVIPCFKTATRTQFSSVPDI